MERSCSYGCLGEGWCISISDSRGSRENYICSARTRRRRERLRTGGDAREGAEGQGLDAPDSPDRADKKCTRGFDYLDRCARESSSGD